MYFSSINVRSAFSLLELLIVIMIVSIVYFLGFNGVEKSENRPKALTPLNLKSTIQNSKLFTGEGTLICINQCKNCYLRKDPRSSFEKYKNKIDLKGIKVYTLDSEDALLKLEGERFQDNKICLEMNFYKNSSATQLILEDKKGVYFLPAFFGGTEKVDSLEEAKALWLKYNRNIAHSGDFY